MRNGILYSIFKFILDNLRHFTLVEWLKLLFQSLNRDPRNQEKTIQYGRFAVDIFIILKWIFVLLMWSLSVSNAFVTAVVWYLILTNIYSYFYYHIWCDDALRTETFSRDRVRRRFLNLILAISYSNLCFAYLYKLPYKPNYKWSDQVATDIKALWFSISNSLAANYDSVKPMTAFGDGISMIQLLITFVFVTIIISKSIPQTSSNN
jgi:hypothetical protein